MSFDLLTDLTFIWAMIIAFGVCLYVILDGFGLGVGILFGGILGEAERDQAMASIAPVWDGNETWLVLGGAGLLAAFPVAYNVLLPAFYIPLTVMLLALIFRGTAFEFRHGEEKRKRRWSGAFMAGSMVAAFCQGLVLGGFVTGVPVEDGQYAGGAFDWFNLFNFFTGLSVVAGYGLLGATWLIMKTEGELQAAARTMAKRLLLGVLAAMAIVSLWMPAQEAAVAARWFSLPNFYFLAPVPIVTGVAALGLWIAIGRGLAWQPFALAIALFLLGYLGLAISMWPYVIPREVTLWDAAAHPDSQSFLLYGAVVLIPIILGYTAYSYWVFRGKVRGDEGYH